MYAQTHVCGPALCTDVCAVEALVGALGVGWGWEQVIHNPGDRDAILPITRCLHGSRPEGKRATGRHTQDRQCPSHLTGEIT